MEGGAVVHIIEKGPPNDHPSQIWFSGFRGEDLNVNVYDVRRTPSDDKRSLGLWPGELNN